MPSLRLGSLCTGYGGLDLAAAAVFDVVPVFHAEVDPAVARVLAHRFPRVPNLGDITALDWTRVPRVDVLCAGYPCQPESLAGQRKGVDDERWIWPSVARAVRVLRPRILLLENVHGHLSLGFRTVLGDLAELGFDAEWLVCAASDLGACHQRKRLFALAWPADTAGHGRGEGPIPAPKARVEGQPAHPAGAAAADTEGVGEREPADQAHPVPEGRDARPLARRRGLLPTPTASLADKGGPNGCHGDGSPTLTAAVQPSRWGKYAPPSPRTNASPDVRTRPRPSPTRTASRASQPGSTNGSWPCPTAGSPTSTASTTTTPYACAATASSPPKAKPPTANSPAEPWPRTADQSPRGRRARFRIRATRLFGATAGSAV